MNSAGLGLVGVDRFVDWTLMNLAVFQLAGMNIALASEFDSVKYVCCSYITFLCISDRNEAFECGRYSCLFIQ